MKRRSIIYRSQIRIRIGAKEFTNGDGTVRTVPCSPMQRGSAIGILFIHLCPGHDKLIDHVWDHVWMSAAIFYGMVQRSCARFISCVYVSSCHDQHCNRTSRGVVPCRPMQRGLTLAATAHAHVCTRSEKLLRYLLVLACCMKQGRAGKTIQGVKIGSRVEENFDDFRIAVQTGSIMKRC